MPKKIKIVTDGWRCERCGHTWTPRTAGVPLTCPKCKSPYWSRPRRTPKPPVEKS